MAMFRCKDESTAAAQGLCCLVNSSKLGPRAPVLTEPTLLSLIPWYGSEPGLLVLFQSVHAWLSLGENMGQGLSPVVSMDGYQLIKSTLGFSSFWMSCTETFDQDIRS